MSNEPTAEVRDLLDRWARAIEAKDMDALSSVFRCDDDLAVFWSNGERNVGWAEVRRHIESDLRQEVGLRMRIDDPVWVPMGAGAGVLSHRYRISLTTGGETLRFDRLATMCLHHEPGGWRIASLHVSAVPPTAG